MKNKILIGDKATLISVPYDNENLNGFRFFMANQLLHENKGNGKTFVLAYKDDMKIKMFRQERGSDNKFYNTEEKKITGLELQDIFKEMSDCIQHYTEHDKNYKSNYQKKSNTLKLSISADERRFCWKALEHSGVSKDSYVSLEEAWKNGDVCLLSASDYKRYAYSQVGLLHCMVRITDGMVFDNPLEILALCEKDKKILFPSTSISIHTRNLYGYRKDDVLPVDKQVALSLFADGYKIYKLYPDNTYKQIEEKKDISSHFGIFGIDKNVWYERNKIEKDCLRGHL